MLEIIFITSLKIIFMYGAMQEGEILFFLRRFFEGCLSKLPLQVEQYLRKPLFDCMFCMSSIWGVTFLLIPMPYILDLVLSIAGLNYLWSAIVGFLHAEKDVAEKEIIISGLEEGSESWQFEYDQARLLLHEMIEAKNTNKFTAASEKVKAFLREYQHLIN